MPAYYNENDPYAAKWLRNLIAKTLIAPGDVDERDIQDVRADDLKGYQQAHFFAGIGGWSIALRLAGWPDDRPVWTGSCPCQPFSAAGAGKASNDERHLWPSWFSLIEKRCPPIVFGEQVEAAIGWGWLDAVFADLEEEGYACGASVLPACSVGAPHIRQRLWFVGESLCKSSERRAGSVSGAETQSGGARLKDGNSGHRLADASKAVRMADSQRTERGQVDSAYRGGGSDALSQGQEGPGRIGSRQQVRSMAHSDGGNTGAEREQRSGEQRQRAQDGGIGELGNAESDQRGSEQQARGTGSGRRRLAGASEAGELGDSPGGEQRRSRLQGSIGGRQEQVGGSSAWASCEWLPCTDGKARPVEPGSFPLAHGVQRRTSKLRAYGNAIVPQAAAEFIRAFMETEGN